MRDRLHGHRARGPDPARAGAGPRRHAEPGLAAVHELLRDHRRLDARHGLRVEPHRPAQDAARRARARDRVLRARGPVRLDPGDRRLPRRLGPGQRALHRHRAFGDHRLGERRRLGSDHSLRGRARARHRLRPAAGRLPRRDLLARSVLRHRGPDGDRLRRDPGAARGTAQTGAQGRHHRAAARAEPPRAADHRPGRALLQLRLLHAARVHAVPAGDGGARARPRVLRLGPAAGDQLGLRRAAAQAPLRGRADARRDVRRAGRDPRRDGLRRGGPRRCWRSR